eukprot:358903-Chlamydomonas_euryale.AAC.2
MAAGDCARQVLRRRDAGDRRRRQRRRHDPEGAHRRRHLGPGGHAGCDGGRLCDCAVPVPAHAAAGAWSLELQAHLSHDLVGREGWGACTHKEGVWRTCTHKEGVWRTCTYKEGGWRTGTHKEGGWRTCTHKEGGWRTCTHKEGGWRTCTHKEGGWRTCTHKEGRGLAHDSANGGEAWQGVSVARELRAHPSQIWQGGSEACERVPLFLPPYSPGMQPIGLLSTM